MWIPRLVEERVRSLAATRPVVVLTGARQTGKTSLAKRLFPAYGYVSLDLPSEAAQAEHDPARFVSRHPAPLVIDEVQYAPGVLRHLKRIVDTRRAVPGQFVLTGSQPFNLMQGVAESLAGRAAVIQLEGLSFTELKAVAPDIAVTDVLLKGGFPELHAEPSIDRTEFFRSYVACYLERDLRSQLRVGNLRDFERFLRAAALRSAQLLNKAELARDIGISGSTAGEWLALLDRGGVISLLEPWFSNRGKSLVKRPKLLFLDVGLCSFLMGLGNTSDLEASPLIGSLWETLVCSEVRRLLAEQMSSLQLHFWRDRSKEADLLLHAGGRFLVADAKWTELPDLSAARRLARVCRELPPQTVTRAAIICRTANRYPLHRDGQLLIEAISLADLPEWLSPPSNDAA
jgi:predicted AAA+ superfamily ATPase